MDVNNLQYDNPHFFQQQNLISTMMEHQKVQFDIWMEGFDDKDEELKQSKHDLENSRCELKEIKTREEGLENEIGEITFKTETLEKEIEFTQRKLFDSRENMKNKDFQLNEYEKMKDIADKVIRKLKEENERLSEEVKELKKKEKADDDFINTSCQTNVKSIEENKYVKEITDLLKEQQVFRIDMNEKKIELGKIDDENKALKNKLTILEEKCNEHKASIENSSKHTVVNVSICEELTQVDPTFSFQNFKCEQCGNKFISSTNLENHIENVHDEKQRWIIQCLEKEDELSRHKLSLAFSLSHLKNTETKETHKCHCRSPCEINHFKYNWKKSKSDELFNRLTNLSDMKILGTKAKCYSCNQCEETFSRMLDLEAHNKSIHKESTNKRIFNRDNFNSY